MRLRYHINDRKYRSDIQTIADDFGRKFHRTKKESIREFFLRVRREAIHNIVENNAETGYPMTGALGGSIDFDVDKQVMWAGDENVPYAAIHDAPTRILIVPVNAKYLVFFNYRKRRMERRTFVLRPGIQFFTKAWTTELKNFDDIFLDKVEENF